ncbi:MAG: hypothetical protein JEZ14_13645 [Marinilabiliaceae bacterium]|nr:hypothetical protein [Marinilabiliaceae bacterium]
MKTKLTLTLLGLFLLTLTVYSQKNSDSSIASKATYESNEKPKLILQITIDQMRGDFPMRYKDRLGDERIISNNHQSRMFSVSIKDRGAILPGGHTGKAFWYSQRDGSFISSTYYYPDYPQWENNGMPKSSPISTKIPPGSC